MEYTIIIGIAGVVTTILFGFLSIDLLKRKRYPGKIAYIKLNQIDLLNNVANNFEAIKLLHDELPIKNNIIYIKGALINIGDIDISSQLTEKNITIHLPKGCSWLDIKPTKFSEGLSVDVDVNHDTDTASFQSELFKRNEAFQFEGLIENSDGTMFSQNIEEEITFSHRIEGTSKIVVKKLLSEKEMKNKKQMTIIYSIFFLFIMLYFFSATLNLFGNRAEKVVFINKSNPTNEQYYVKLKDSVMELEPLIYDKEKFQLPIDEFNSNYKASTLKITFIEKFKKSYWIISLYLGIILIFLFSDIFEMSSSRKITKILNKNFSQKNNI